MPRTIQIDGLLTKDDRATLEEIIRWYRNIQRDKIQRPIPRVDVPDSETTEVYIARTIDDGIPPLEEEPGAGYKDQPGEAICEIYCILRKSTSYELWPVPQLKQRVFNLTTQSIPPNEWLPIMRDKFGRWLAVRGGTSVGGETGFWCRVDQSFCLEGRHSIVELEKRPYGGFVDKEDGITSDQAFHCDKSNYQEGPLLVAGIISSSGLGGGTICWARPGYFSNEYILECAAGWTGTKWITVDVLCSNGQLIQLKWYFHYRNGQLTREPCVGNINICGPCSGTHPLTPGLGSFFGRAALALAGLAAAAGALL